MIQIDVCMKNHIYFHFTQKLMAQRSNARSFVCRYLRNVTIDGEFSRPDVSFSSDGTLKNVELKIMNLRPGLSSNLVWEEIGVWKSYEEDNAGLDIKDIVWPGHSHVPPQVLNQALGFFALLYSGYF